MGTSFTVMHFIESRHASGGVTRDAWLARWGKPTRKALAALLSKTPAIDTARVVRQSGEVVVPWICR